MSNQLYIYNSLTRSKQPFKPLIEGRVGMYVCGPTVYSNVHLGNCRTFTSFDMIYRYLTHLGNKVRYVRNITDVGHLENEGEMTGEDRIAKKARLEQIEPMEIVQRYTVDFHEVMSELNNNPPSIEPSATGHIIEQIEMVQKILENGYAYERNGSVYFRTVEFAKKHPEYGQISGKKIDDLQTETRELKSQSEKDHPADFAIWMKAHEGHIMRWESPWSVGFPGWHLECSAMSTKYLGERFDIHGGGMDLQFPHHENEVAQNIGCCGTAPANYWIHTNMLTFEGVKMSKSKNNSILPNELFTGEHELLSQAYSPMTLRFFFLRSHYRSICDFSDVALQAAEKSYERLMAANKDLQELEYIGNKKEKNEDKAIIDLLDSLNILIEDKLEINEFFTGIINLQETKSDETLKSLSKLILKQPFEKVKSFIDFLYHSLNLIKSSKRKIVIQQKNIIESLRIEINLISDNSQINKLLAISYSTLLVKSEYIETQRIEKHIESFYNKNVLSILELYSFFNDEESISNNTKKKIFRYTKALISPNFINNVFYLLALINEKKFEQEDRKINDLLDKMYEHMNDDFNTPRVLASMFEIVRKINIIKNKKTSDISPITFKRMQVVFNTFIKDVLGLKEEEVKNDEMIGGVVNILIDMRKKAKENKDYITADKIRKDLIEAGIQLKDSKDGTTWSKV